MKMKHALFFTVAIIFFTDHSFYKNDCDSAGNDNKKRVIKTDFNKTTEAYKQQPFVANDFRGSNLSN